jgi:hypothetical protein
MKVLLSMEEKWNNFVLQQDLKLQNGFESGNRIGKQYRSHGQPVYNF